jgi:hypothetical protein
MSALIHDHAMAAATAVLAIFAPLLREEEQREAFGMVYTAIKAAFEHYETAADRRERRLRPSKN